VIKRQLFERLGPFVERLPCEDYNFWLRSLGTGAVFYYDPTILVRYRRHESNVTNDLLRMYGAAHLVHRWNVELIKDRRFVRSVLASDKATIGRLLVDAGRPREALAEFMASLRYQPTPHAAVWVALLSAPKRLQPGLVGTSLSVKRRLSARFGAATT
jgi:hypothetical protein